MAVKNRFWKPAVRGGYPELAICQKTWENRYSVIAAILPLKKLIYNLNQLLIWSDNRKRMLTQDLTIMQHWPAASKLVTLLPCLPRHSWRESDPAPSLESIYSVNERWGAQVIPAAPTSRFLMNAIWALRGVTIPIFWVQNSFNVTPYAGYQLPPYIRMWEQGWSGLQTGLTVYKC